MNEHMRLVDSVPEYPKVMPCHLSVLYATFLKSQHFLGIFLLSPMALQISLGACFFMNLLVTTHFSPLILRVMKGMNVYHVSAISQDSLDEP